MVVIFEASVTATSKTVKIRKMISSRQLFRIQTFAELCRSPDVFMAKKDDPCKMNMITPVSPIARGTGRNRVKNEPVKFFVPSKGIPMKILPRATPSNKATIKLATENALSQKFFQIAEST